MSCPRLKSNNVLPRIQDYSKSFSELEVDLQSRKERAMVWYQKWGRGTSPAEVTIEVQDRNCKADGGSRRKRGGRERREESERERTALVRCDLYPDIRRNSGKRYFNDFQTRSMEDPRWPSLPLLSAWCTSRGRSLPSRLLWRLPRVRSGIRSSLTRKIADYSNSQLSTRFCRSNSCSRRRDLEGGTVINKRR